jgi:DNA primase
MNILQMVENKFQIRPVKVSGNKGGEYHSPCPACGGTDRFHIWPAQGELGTFWCRSCDKGGDAVKYLRLYEGMSCGAAHAALGKECKANDCAVSGNCRRGKGGGEKRNHSATPEMRRARGAEWQPSEALAPEQAWREHATKLVDTAHEALLAASETLAYLEGRGLPLDAVKRFRLGWLEKDTYRAREAWGLPTELKEGGKKKKLWLPKGIVIPFFVDGELHRIRIRRDQVSGNEPRYYWVPGSGNDVVVFNPEANAFVVVETDLDGLMVAYLAGDLVGAVPLGTCSAKPKEAAAMILREALAILVALDFEPRRNERTGQVENPGGQAARWWKENFPRSKRWPPRIGKDPGEDYAAGTDIRAWILAGLPPAMTIETKGASTMAPESESFNSEKCIRLISEARGRIASACPPGAPDWLEENKGDVWRYLKAADKAVDDAFETRDEQALIKNLKAWEKYHLRAWEIFNERPKVIER